MVSAKFLSADQNWQDGNTTYWFYLNGVHRGTDEEFAPDQSGSYPVFGVVEGGESAPAFVFENGEAVPPSPLLTALADSIRVTDDLRQRVAFG